ncbi:MAG: histidine kinase [Chitinophagales bacterium]|nr:histidine kinase [Chitinophagales bacterium]
MKNRFVILILLLSAWQYSNAQRPYFNTHELPRELSGSSIEVLYQDNSGFIWLGSSIGLILFDGLDYTLIENPDTNCSNIVSSIGAVGNDLWIGYKDGCVAMLTNFEIKPHYEFEGITTPITGIIALEDRSIAIATYGQGFYFKTDDVIQNMNSNSGLADDFLYSIFQDEYGNIWVGGDKGIDLIDPSTGSISSYNSASGLPDDIVLKITADDKKQIWIGMHDRGVAYFDRDLMSFTVPELLKNWSYGPVTDILPMENEIWIATKRNGIVALVDQYDSYVRVYDKEYGLNQHLVKDLLIDHESNIWIASGVNYLKSTNKQFEFIYDHEEINFGNLHTVMADQKGVLWFSNNEGLFSHKIVFTGFNVLRKWFDITSLNNQQILSLYPDVNGRIWIGTFGDGAYCLDPVDGSILQFNEAKGLINNNVFSIDGGGNEIWFATLGGTSRTSIDVNTFPDLIFNNFQSRDGLANDFIYKVYTDSRNRTWFGTDGGGMSVYENGAFINYSEIEDKVVLSIVEDGLGNIWFSTASNGIYKFDGQNFTNYDQKKGIAGQEITSLAIDKNGDLVIVTNWGINILNISNDKIRYFGAETGILSSEQELNAIAKDINGDIWIPTASALIKYMAEEGEGWRNPKVNMTAVNIYFDEENFIDNAKFDHDQNHITFKFVGLWYQNPGQVKYQYKLEGYDLDWITTKDKSVTYPKLSHGNFAFKLRSSSNNDFDSSEILTHHFSVSKPFWKRHWFLALIGLIMLVMVYWVIKSREDRLKNEAELRKAHVVHQFETLKSQVNPHFLFNSFNTLASIIEEDQKMAVEYVEKLSDFFRNILQYQEKEVIMVHEEIRLLNEYFYLQQKRYGENLKLNMEIPYTSMSYKISPLTLQLLVENAIKHNVISKRNPLEIEIRSDGDYLIIENMIKSKKQEIRSTKTGLANISDTYKLLTNKPVTVKSDGLKFKVGIPLIKQS